MIEEMAWYDAYLARGQVDRSANTTPGNKKGGLSNIVEKAMGSIVKSGSAPTTKWQQPFDAALTDVFQVQADVASRVAQALDVALSTGEKAALVTILKKVAAHVARQVEKAR